MIALIGFSGFVGSNILKHLPINSTSCYNSKNIHEISNKVFKTVYCAGLYAEKWKINLDSNSDMESIINLQKYISTVKCEQFILLSTVDVLDTNVLQNEDGCIYSTHSYGKNRLIMENWCMNNFENCHIVRLPALYGFGLKKNALYDLLNNNNIEKIRSHWIFQWYNLEWLYNDIQNMLKKNIKLLHFVSVSISIETISSLFFPNIHIKNNRDIIVDYKIISKYDMKTQKDILDSMDIFINSYRINGKLLVSELAWLEKDESYMRSYLQSNGINNIESVPSRNFNHVNSTYSIQSLLYGNSIQIFKEQLTFKNIIKNLCEKFHKFNTEIFIFGSPKNRNFNGEDSHNLFKEIGDICSRYNIIFCIENNSRKYDCNWLNTARETIDFVKKLNHKNIGVNLDIGNMIMENENMQFSEDDVKYIKHIQISFPYLSDWDTTYESYISENIKSIMKTGYNKKISLEVKHSKEICFENIKSFISLMNSINVFNT